MHYALLKLLWRYKRYIAIALALLAAIWLVWAQVAAYGSRREQFGRNEVQRAWDADKAKAKDTRIAWYEDQIKAAKAAQAVAEADTAVLGARLADEQANASRLQNALSRAKMVSHVPSSTPGEPPVVRLSRDFRVCINAAVTGSADEISACEAIGVPVPATP